MIIVKIIYWIILIALGYLIIRYRRDVRSWTGNFVWAERYLGSGWTYLVLVLVWLALIFFGTIYPFWWLEVLIWK